IENTTNRQVTFSKRRNGLIKKAYELSVLCDVDVALILFSPSGRLTFFSGPNNIEDILSRYVNLAEKERGRLNKFELLQNAVAKLQAESDHHAACFPGGGGAGPSGFSDASDSQLQEFERVGRLRDEIEALQRQLRIFEGDVSQIMTTGEADYQEQMLYQTLQRVLNRKQVLEMKLVAAGSMSFSQVQVPPLDHDANGLVITANELPPTVLERTPHYHDPQNQVLDFQNSNVLLPDRRQLAPIPPVHIEDLLSQAVEEMPGHRTWEELLLLSSMDNLN
ncbi:unnamed protein product, partial [Linum tenue]